MAVKTIKSYIARPSEVTPAWHMVDASTNTLGRIATEVAGLLMGKHKPQYARYINTGDFVVVTNAARLRVTGKKMQDKMYYRNSGYPGGLKSVTLGDMLQKSPNKVIEHAVRGMLPKNALGETMIKRLKVFPGDAQQLAGRISAALVEESGPASQGKEEGGQK